MKATKLQVTNGYSVNFDQLAKLVAAIERDGRASIPLVDLASSVGIAYRQAKDVGSIAQAFGLAEIETLRSTPLAAVLSVRDRFFDDVGTLWFLHYVVASEPRHLVWNRFANDVVPEQSRVTRETFREAFDDLKQTHSAYSARTHLTKEISAILDVYANQNFARLAYLRDVGNGVYAPGYCEAVPPLVLAACIARFRARHRPGDTAISVSDLLTARNSPGVVCRIPEDRLRAGLEALKREPGLSLESRADLDQIRLTDDTPDYRWMERYYAGRE